MRPGAPPKSSGYVCTGPGEVSSLVTDPPGTPVTPRIRIYYITIWWVNEVLRLYRRATHTHTLPLAGWCHGKWGEDEDERGNEREMNMKMRWKIAEPEREEGNAKEEGENTHQHTWPEAGKPWKGKGREKRRADRHGTRPAEGGKTGRRKRLNQPDTAKTYTNLSTRRTRPTWRGKNAWNRGPMGVKLVKEENQHQELRGPSSTYNKSRGLLPFGTVVKSCRNGTNSCSSSSELDAQYVQPHQKTIKRKRQHLESMSLPGLYFMLLCKCPSKSCADEKEAVSAVPCNLISAKVQVRKDPLRDHRSSGNSQKTVKNGKAVCSTLLKRITNWKVSIQRSNSSTVTHNGVASSGPMAPCRSHHRYYTRQEWIL